MLLDQRVQSRWLSSLHLIDLLTALEDHESGHGRDSEVSSDVLGGVYIALEEGHAGLVGRRELEASIHPLVEGSRRGRDWGRTLAKTGAMTLQGPHQLRGGWSAKVGGVERRGGAGREE